MHFPLANELVLSVNESEKMYLTEGLEPELLLRATGWGRGGIE